MKKRIHKNKLVYLRTHGLIQKLDDLNNMIRSSNIRLFEAHLSGVKK